MATDVIFLVHTFKVYYYIVGHFCTHFNLTFPLPPGNLKDEDGAAERTLEDFFIRKFIEGTFHQCLATDLIIKRRGNQIFLVAMMLRRLAPQKFYFLIGYTEELLSHWFKCPVKMEVQVVDERPIYKWI